MGFIGKLAINPRQVEVIHKTFNPSPNEIDWAQRVIDALEEAKSRGAGAIAVDGKMIDLPVVARAERVLNLAKQLHLTEEVMS